MREGAGLQVVVGTGVDVVDIDRFAAALSRRPGLEARLFNAQELFALPLVGRPARLAARFAAKEAVLKAIGTGLRDGTWHDLVLTRDALGKPSVQLRGGIAQSARARGIEQVLISISHSRTTAVATAVAGR